MPLFFAKLVDRIDRAHLDQAYFLRIKARLLASFCGLLLVFVPFNIGKLLWIRPPELAFRIEFNLSLVCAALLALSALFRGRLNLAGNTLALLSVLPVHALLFLVPDYVEPLGVAVQIFAFDLGFLLLALVFATTPVTVLVLAVMAASRLVFHRLVLHETSIPGSLDYTADALLRDGMIAIGFVFTLGLILRRMIEAANRRSELALQETRALNTQLERLVDERTEELTATTRRAEEASRAKTDFLANMSHEIRTPLNGIIASAELLLHKDGLATEQRDHVRLIAESGDLLLKLLSDILDLSKIEADKLQLETHPFELAPLVAECTALLSTRAVEGDVHVTQSIDPDLPRYFEGDSFRLRQVLLNLISNAIKFTPVGGSVRVAVTATTLGANPPLVRFEVSDSGIGMDADMSERIFQRFTQADSSTTRRFGGSGLGLAISARLVARMGGCIEVASAPGKGSVFHFSLPLPTVERLPEADTATADSSAPLGMRILVAEDNAVNRKILANQLRALGCEFTLTLDGAEALNAIDTAPLPDIVLMDCHMPNLDGWDATRRLRAWATEPDGPAHRRAAAALPVVALTAAALPEERARCLDAGMTDFLAKPVKLGALRQVLQRYLPAGSSAATATKSTTAKPE